MTGELPNDGKARDIFLRALREYSENCRPPELTPGCPFAYVTGQGVRGCAEECVDLLAEHAAPPPLDEVDVGDGLVLRPRRPRARRGPTKTTRPFDARRIYGEDSDSGHELGRWRMTSLIVGLRDAATRPPPADAADAKQRRDEISAYMAELERRGVDAERLIREGLYGVIVGVMMSRIVLLPDLIPGDELEQGDGSPDRALVDAWRSCLAVQHIPEGASVEELVDSLSKSEIPTRLIAWLQVAPVDDLLDWRPPATRAALLACRSPEATDGPFMWLADRFANTYLRDWHPGSLKWEWRYIHGECLGPCRSVDMAGVKIDEVDLAKRLADLSTNEAQASKASVVKTASAEDYVDVALRLLGSGRRSAAADMFEMVVAADPENVMAHNNWGFCLLPDDPERALRPLDRAAELGLADDLMNIGNRLYCLWRLGRYASALKLADATVARWDGLPPRLRVYMWSLDNGGEFVHLQDIRPYVVELIQRIAASTKDTEIIRDWHERLGHLGD